MPTYYEPNPNNTNVQAGVVNGVSGKWIPVTDSNSLPNAISYDPSNPTRSADGNIYYARETQSLGQAPIDYSRPAPIAANSNNAIPTPSQIVQMPPIVQPISLVPVLSQNQPLLQYDSNYRPPVVPETVTPEPVYRRKPYIGISTATMLLSIFALAILALLGLFSVLTESNAVAAGTQMNLYDAIKVLLSDGFFTKAFESGKVGQYSDVFIVIVGIAYAVVAVLSLINIVYGGVKVGQMKPMAKCNGFALASFILSLACAILLNYDAITGASKPCLQALPAAYIVTVVFFIAFLLPLFINKNAQTIDYKASKQVYTVKK